MELSFTEKVILEHAQNEHTVFVFPTGISAQLWLDRYLEIIGTGTCALEKFIAWDTFKSSAVRSTMQDKKSIPSALRKMFAAMLIAENSQLIRAGNPPVFNAIIPPEYESSASSFVPWITSILPELASWKEKITAQNGIQDEEDRDLLSLFERYKAFLSHNGLFEPAWEKPPFESNDNHYYIFFTEIISDFAEYETLLTASQDITVVETPKPNPQYDAFIYAESRSELREAALFVRNLYENEHIPYEEIAVSIPDLENYKQYLLREFHFATYRL